MALATAYLFSAHIDAVDWLQVRHIFNSRLYGTAGGWDSTTYLLLGALGVALILLTSVAIWRTAVPVGFVAAGATLGLAVVLLWDTWVSLAICTGCDGGFPNPVSAELNRAGDFLALVGIICTGGLVWLGARERENQRFGG